MGKRGKFLLGALVGAGIGLMFAPRKGSETRKELKVKLKDLLDKVKEIDDEEIAKEILEKIDDLREELQDLDEEKVVEIARKKASQVKDKAEELVNLAVEKGTPVLKDAALEVKSKAILVAKETIEKLESTDKKKKEEKASYDAFLVFIWKILFLRKHMDKIFWMIRI